MVVRGETGWACESKNTLMHSVWITQEEQKQVNEDVLRFAADRNDNSFFRLYKDDETSAAIKMLKVFHYVELYTIFKRFLCR